MTARSDAVRRALDATPHRDYCHSESGGESCDCDYPERAAHAVVPPGHVVIPADLLAILLDGAGEVHDEDWLVAKAALDAWAVQP